MSENHTPPIKPAIGTIWQEVNWENPEEKAILRIFDGTEWIPLSECIVAIAEGGEVALEKLSAIEVALIAIRTIGPSDVSAALQEVLLTVQEVQAAQRERSAELRNLAQTLDLQ